MKKTANRRDGVPIYARIYEQIRSEIRSGELKIGDRIESERQLAVRHKVSVMTARQAVSSLERDGLVERKRGSGTYVSSPRINWNQLQSFTEQMGARGIPCSSRLLSVSMVRADDNTAAQLGVAREAPLVRVERLRLGGPEPLAVEDCLLPLDRFPNLLSHRFERSSLFQILEQEYHVRIARADELIEAQAASKRIAGLLGITAGSPVLHLTQVLLAVRSQPVAVSAAWYRADRHHFKIVRTRESGGIH
jgi:GntR family transcriptional regulator